MRNTSETLTLFTAGALFIALASLALYSLHLLDRLLFALLGAAPFVAWFATPMGWGMFHLPTAFVVLMIVAALPAAWYGARGLVALAELLIKSLDEPEEETAHV